MTLEVEEDEENFYFVKKIEPYIQPIDEAFARRKNSIYELLECYLQIVEALIYLHTRDFYHGNLSPETIVVNGENRVFLVDFGKSYYYNYTNIQNQTPFSTCEPSREADIYNFGLCCFKIYLQENNYLDLWESFERSGDIDNALAEIEHYDRKNSDLFILIKQILTRQKSLHDVKKELEEMLDDNERNYTFEINLDDKLVESWANEHYLANYQVATDIEEKIKEFKHYFSFGKDPKNPERTEIRILCGEMVLFCSTREEQRNFFCFGIKKEGSAKFEKDAVYKKCDFVVTTGRASGEYDDASDVVERLKDSFKANQQKATQDVFNQKAIKSEEELLVATKKSIEKRKNRAVFKFDKSDKGEDEAVFVEKEEEGDETSRDESGKNTNQNERAKKTEIAKFKDGEKVVIVVANRHAFDGEPVETATVKKHENKKLTLKFEKYALNKLEFDEKDNYEIEVDLKIEEILLSKREKALESLKDGNTQIEHFLKKINEPKHILPNELVELEKFYNDELDENQKKAVIKALSLKHGCEILFIQGPPGTGKTTTITEIVRQELTDKPHSKILVSSQSNQAVDNVLEKICGEENKILRIGNDATKMSEIAQKFRPEIVLNALINANLKRIEKNPPTHLNGEIQKKLEECQNKFKNSLTNISAALASDSKKRAKEAKLANLFLKHIRLFFGTLLGVSSWSEFKDMVFDLAIVDEAGRATLSEMLVPCIKARRVIFVGDHKQLAPVIDDDVVECLENSTKDEVATSFFERCFERFDASKEKFLHLENHFHTLTYNYRTNRAICDIYSKAFYDGALKTRDEIDEARKHGLGGYKNAVWLDMSNVAGKEDEQEGTGKKNRKNAAFVVKFLDGVKERLPNSQIKTIGVITPYRAQLNLLKEELKKAGLLAFEVGGKKFNVDVGTVDSFQGSDRDLVIYDCVRSGKKKGGQIGFIADEKRLNVSLSRAKRLLVVVGDMEFLYMAGGENPFKEIVDIFNKNKNDYEIVRLK